MNSDKWQQSSHRWNILQAGDGVRICFGQHEKDEPCEYKHYVPAPAQPLTERVAQLESALRDTLDFVERHSNRWDGVNGKHPFNVVENARAVLVASQEPPK